jgi:hypothetical protein
VRNVRRTGRRAAGIRYEQRVQDHFTELFDGFYVPGPWFCFGEAGRANPRWCQPDGLLFQPRHQLITILEIKYQHTPDAWWQLKTLYYPILAVAFPPNLWRFAFCEVVKWHDPAVAFPEPYRLTPSPAALSPGAFGVHIIKV